MDQNSCINHKIAKKYFEQQTFFIKILKISNSINFFFNNILDNTILHIKIKDVCTT